eukprot:jgi/Galph1/2592/GphlegSOOS_G1249.1
MESGFVTEQSNNLPPELSTSVYMTSVPLADPNATTWVAPSSASPPLQPYLSKWGSVDQTTSYKDIHNGNIENRGSPPGFISSSKVLQNDLSCSSRNYPQSQAYQLPPCHLGFVSTTRELENASNGTTGSLCQPVLHNNQDYSSITSWKEDQERKVSSNLDCQVTSLLSTCNTSHMPSYPYLSISQECGNNFLGSTWEQSLSSSINMNQEKETLIWNLERVNQSLRKELESCRREIDGLRAQLNASESIRQKGDNNRSHSRYWTREEHQRFLEAIQKFGPKDVKAISNYVGTRNPTQVRTHAQKYFQRMFRDSKTRSSDKLDVGFSTSRRSMSAPDLYKIELQSSENALCSLFMEGPETNSVEHGSSNNHLASETLTGKTNASGMELLSSVASSSTPFHHQSNDAIVS